MRYIKSNTLTVEEFINKLHSRAQFTSRQNDSESKISISFQSPFTWGDGSEKIDSLTVQFDRESHNISKITIVGSNLVQIVGYTYLNECYLWFTIKDMSQFDFEHVDDIPGVLILNV